MDRVAAELAPVICMIFLFIVYYSRAGAKHDEKSAAVELAFFSLRQALLLYKYEKISRPTRVDLLARVDVVVSCNVIVGLFPNA